MIALASGLRVYLACGAPPNGSSASVCCTSIARPVIPLRMSVAVFAFRGRRAGLIKLIWYHGVGLRMLTKRLEARPVRVAVGRQPRTRPDRTWPSPRVIGSHSPAAIAPRNLGALPAHLPRYEVVIDAEHSVPCCGGDMHSIGELRTGQLDIVPMQLRVRVTRRPRYACRACEGAVVVAEAPARPIDDGMIRAQRDVNLRHRRRSDGEVVRERFARLPTCPWPMPFMTFVAIRETTEDG